MTRIKLSVAGIITGCLFLLMPGLALLRSVPEVNYTYWVITSAGMGNPASIKQNLETIKILTAAGIILWLLGIILLAVSLVVFAKARAAKEIPT